MQSINTIVLDNQNDNNEQNNSGYNQKKISKFDFNDNNTSENNSNPLNFTFKNNNNNNALKETGKFINNNNIEDNIDENELNEYPSFSEL